MVKVRGSHHARPTMHAYVQRRFALQKRELAREEEELREQLQAQVQRQLSEYEFDANDNGRFAGYDAIFRCEGDNYEVLHRVLKKIMRPAHYRTWAAANSDKGNGPPPCLTAREIAERVGRHKRTIEIDLQEMRKSRLLHIQPAQRNGRWVMEMHYDVLYRLVHEYLEWERSADYIPPERMYFEYIQLAPDLKRQLLQFEDYRKVLGKKKPGPKTKEKPHCYEKLISHQPYVGGRSQYISSASLVAPTASQGDMERSIYSEPPVPLTLPQVGRSGSAHPNGAIRQLTAHDSAKSAIEEKDVYDLIKILEAEQISQECRSSASEQQACQEYSSGSVFQEVPIMSSQVKEFTFKDKIGNSYVYPTSSLPMFFVEVPREQDESLGLTEITYYVDKEDILHISDKYVPFLRDMLICTKSDYDHSHYHHRAAFEPELQRLFDPKAVGVWVAHIPEVNEIMMMMEYDPRRDNVNEYMTFLAQDMENILCYQDEDLKNELVPFGADKISIFEIQEDAVRHYVVPDEPLDLSVEGVWTPALSIFVEFGHRATRFFIPRVDFPPEVEAAFPDYQMGVWVTMRPGEREAYVQPCYELFMEGIEAKPWHLAIVEARIRYLDTLHPKEETSVSDMEASISTLCPEHLTDEIPIVSTSVPEAQEAVNNYAPEIQEVTNDYAFEAQEVADDHHEEEAGTTISLTASGENFIGETEKPSKVMMPMNKASGQELRCDRPVKGNEPSVGAEPQGHKHAHSPIVTGTLSKMNLAHRSLSRRIVGNRRGTREQEPKRGPVFAQVQEVVHDGGMGGSYPVVVPLLQDFMRTKLLGNDIEKRYFIPYEVLKSPGIENAFPPGTDGVWIWKQPAAQIVHIKPSCMAIDPYLKNRSVTVIAVGKVADDDDYLYFGKTGGEPTSKIQQPRGDDYGNVAPEVSSQEQPRARKTSPTRAQQLRGNEEDTIPETSPLVPPRTGRTSVSGVQRPKINNDGNRISPVEPPNAGKISTFRGQQAEVDTYGDASSVALQAQPPGAKRTTSSIMHQLRVDEYGNMAPEGPPIGSQRVRGMSTSRTEWSEGNNYGMPSSASPPLSVQQKQAQYQALMKRARDGQGKGFQRLF